MSIGIGIGYIPAILENIEYISVGQSSGACLENVHFIDKTFQMVKTRTDFLNPIISVITPDVTGPRASPVLMLVLIYPDMTLLSCSPFK